MAEQPERPVALRVIPENIPDELKRLMTWCCWRFEWNGKRWAKVPYTPFTTDKAAVNRLSSLRTFQSAYNCYAEYSFDGIFLCLTEDDPYAGGDFDHTTDQSRVPNTYAEYSPSGEGIRFIGKGTLPKACKRAEGELYDRKRFLSITGHRLEGFPKSPLSIQTELDALYEVLQSTPGTGGRPRKTKDRAALATAIPESVWGEARLEQRANISRLLHNLRQSAVSNKTGRDDTKLGFLLREDYRGFHEKWPRSNIIRSDGSIDESQVRAVMAGSIKGRGFTFVQYVALMSHFFGYDCLTKWKTKQAVREEFAALWDWADNPRAGAYAPRAMKPVGRGRASDHGELLDRAYGALVTFKAGTEAFLTIADLGEALGCHPRTAATLLRELVESGKINYRSARWNSGIVVSFQGGMIIDKEEKGDIGDRNGLNGHQKDLGIAPENQGGMIIAENEKSVLQHKHAEIQAEASAEITADEPAPSIYIYKQYCVSSASSDHTPLTCKPDTRSCITLDAAITEAFEALPKDRVNEKTGTLTRWPITNRRIVEYVQGEYPGEWKPAAIEYRAGMLRKRRKAADFEALKKLKRTTVEKKAASLARYQAKLEERAATDPMQDIREWAAKEARRLKGRIGRYGWELGRREQEDAARIAAEGYSPGEQAEFLEIVAQEYKPPPSASLPTAEGMVERLRRLKQERT